MCCYAYNNKDAGLIIYADKSKGCGSPLGPPPAGHWWAHCCNRGSQASCCEAAASGGAHGDCRPIPLYLHEYINVYATLKGRRVHSIVKKKQANHSHANTYSRGFVQDACCTHRLMNTCTSNAPISCPGQSLRGIRSFRGIH